MLHDRKLIKGTYRLYTKKGIAQMRSLWYDPKVMQLLTIDRYCRDPKILYCTFFPFCGPGIHIGTIQWL